jgi:hypothetical protein
VRLDHLLKENDKSKKEACVKLVASSHSSYLFLRLALALDLQRGGPQKWHAGSVAQLVRAHP